MQGNYYWCLAALILISSVCADPYIEILTDGYVFENEETIYFTPKVYEADDYVIEYWIEDLNGGIVKGKKETANSNQKQWTPGIDKEEQAFIIRANITYLTFNDSNLDNNYDEVLIAVVKEEDIGDYSDLRINELMPDPQGDDNAAMPSGEWIEIYNLGDSSLDLGGLALHDNYGSSADLYIAESNTLYGTVIGANGYLVVYMNGRSGFLNNDGFEKISLYKDDVLIDSVSYSDSNEGDSYALIEDKWRLSVPSPGSENKIGEKDSSIEIGGLLDLGQDDLAEYGQVVRVKLDVYKGDTTKNQIKVWAEDKNGEKISKNSNAMVYTKYHNYSLTIPLFLKPNCDWKFSDGKAKLFVEGLDTKEEENFKIEGREEDNCIEVEVSSKSSKKFDYYIISKPEVVLAGDSFITKVRIENNDNTDVNIDIWSYAYRGSKSYSGEREGNKESFLLKANESTEVSLVNKIDSSGEFDFKVMIRKDEQKTTKDIKNKIIVVDSGCEYSEDFRSLATDEMNRLQSYVNYSLPELQGMVVYESTSEKSRRLIPYFFIFTLTLICMFLVFKKDIP